MQGFRLRIRQVQGDFKSLNPSKTRSLHLLIDQSKAQVKTWVLDGPRFSKNQQSWVFFSLRLESSAADRKFRKIFHICTFKISGIICGVKFC